MLASLDLTCARGLIRVWDGDWIMRYAFDATDPVDVTRARIGDAYASAVTAIMGNAHLTIDVKGHRFAYTLTSWRTAAPEHACPTCTCPTWVDIEWTDTEELLSTFLLRKNPLL